MRVSAARLEGVAKEWQAAFSEAHGKTAPSITLENGWFQIGDDRPKYRRWQIERMTKVLRAGFDD